MNSVISKTIKISVDSLPPNISCIESEIVRNKIYPLRWAIVEVEDKVLTLNVSGEKIDD